eukprot:2421153-Rhodomonas_salina.1
MEEEIEEMEGEEEEEQKQERASACRDCLGKGEPVSGTSLRPSALAPYALSGTDRAYPATRCGAVYCITFRSRAVRPRSDPPIVLRAPYAMPGAVRAVEYLDQVSTVDLAPSGACCPGRSVSRYWREAMLLAYVSAMVRCMRRLAQAMQLLARGYGATRRAMVLAHIAMELAYAAAVEGYGLAFRGTNAGYYMVLVFLGTIAGLWASLSWY